VRVLLTADAIGGVWTFALDLVRSLSDRVGFLLAIEGGDPSDAQRHDLDELGVEWRAIPNKLEWMDSPWSDVDATGEWLRSLARGFGPDVVHLNSYSHATPAWDRPVLVTAHSCVLSWWKDVKGELPPDTLQTYRDRVQRGLANADLVTGPTRALLRDVQTFYGRPRAARVIANGSDVTPVDVPNEPLVVAAGRMWDEAKNLAILEEVAPLVTWPVVACGPGSEVARNVRGTGRLRPAELIDVFSRAGIFCGPARYEPFGLSALEAARCGCALVLGDIPSLREVWQHAATFVPTDSPAEIASALQRLIDDPVELSERADAARSRAETFTTERMANAYLHAYREIAGRAAERGVGASA
jgi:glycogen synthase